MSDQYRYVLVAWDGDDDQRTDVLDRNQVVDRGPLKQGQKVKAKWRGTNYSATVLAWDGEYQRNLVFCLHVWQMCSCPQPSHVKCGVQMCIMIYTYARVLCQIRPELMRVN